MLDIKALILSRGQSAKDMIDNEAYQHAIKEIRSEYVSELLNTKAKDSEIRERAYVAVRILNEVDQRLRSYISNAAYEQNT